MNQPSGSSRQPDFLQNDGVPDEIGALRLWWTELSFGKRQISDIDSLWRAACKEAQARESIRLGLYSAARDERLAAALLLVEELGADPR